MSISTEVDMERIPRHIAVIMDGNGRWAKAKGLPRTAGHQQGVETVKKFTKEELENALTEIQKEEKYGNKKYGF